MDDFIVKTFNREVDYLFDGILNSKNPFHFFTLSTVDNLKIRLNDTMLDMDKKVRVTYHGKTIFNDVVPRLPSVITRTIKENGDPMSIFYGEIIISLESED